MWYFKNSVIIFICISWIGCDSVANGKCYNDVENYNLTMNQAMLGPQPGKISTDYSSLTAVLEVNVLERRENFNLTLLGIPYKKSISECPATPITMHEHLRQYTKTCTVYQKPKKKIPSSFEIMFTGCYYFIMTNVKGNTWQWGPEFYETKSIYHDTALELTSEPKFKFDNSSMEVNAMLKVPLACIEVSSQLFEFRQKVDPRDDIEKFHTLPLQECQFIEEQGNISCTVSNVTTSLVLDSRVEWASEREWSAEITWKYLQHDGATYYFRFKPYNVFCEGKYSRSELYSWRPVNSSILIGPYTIKPEQLDPRLESTDQNSVCILLGVITLIVILVFCCCKYGCFPKNPRPVLKKYIELQESPLIYNGIESDNILLLYVSGSPLFMDLMSNFRDHLKQTCDCRVYDVYASSEWNMIMEFGVHQRVEQLLRNGCKVVWVNTPELHSRCNEEPEQYIGTNFCDTAMPYALRLINDSYGDCATQYLYHFVVCMEGYEVQDRYGDPLEAVAPHRRYSIPKQLHLLDKELRDLIKPTRNAMCEA